MDEKQIVKNIKKFRTSKKMSLDRLAKIGNPPVYPLKLLAFWTGFPRNALQYSYYVRYRISGWKTQKYMDVIRSYSHLLNLKPMTLSYLPKHLFNSITYIFSLNPFSIFGRPDQMVLGIVDRMCRPSDCHAILISYSICLWQTHLSSPPTGRGSQVWS
jgi:hypothetical protein